MDVEKLLDARTKAVQELLVCTEPGPIQGVCLGPDEPACDDDQWKLQIYTRGRMKGGDREALESKLKALDVPFSIIEWGKISLLRPGSSRGTLRGGISPGSAIFAGAQQGTLGLVVTKNGMDRYLLSCSHVLQDSSDVSANDTGSAIQIAGAPSVIDFNTEPIVADAGIAKFVDGVHFTTAFPAVLPRVTSTVTAPQIGMTVLQSGAESTLRQVARICKWPCDFCIESMGNFHHFANVAVTDNPNFAQNGDSGSVAVSAADGSLVGIVFSRFTPSGGPFLLCALSPALSRFGVTPVV